MNDVDPYGLPTFPGEDVLDGWVDHSEIQLRDVRVFTRGSLTATLISHPGVWDVIVSDGAGNVEFLVDLHRAGAAGEDVDGYAESCRAAVAAAADAVSASP